MVNPIINNRHVEEYLALIQKSKLTAADEKNLIALLTLFMEDLPYNDKISSDLRNKVFIIRDKIKKRLEAYGFKLETENIEKGTNIEEYIPLVIKLAYCYSK